MWICNNVHNGVKTKCIIIYSKTFPDPFPFISLKSKQHHFVLLCNVKRFKFSGLLSNLNEDSYKRNNSERINQLSTLCFTFFWLVPIKNAYPPHIQEAFFFFCYCFYFNNSNQKGNWCIFHFHQLNEWKLSFIIRQNFTNH